MRRVLILILIVWVAGDLAAHNSKIATINLSIVDGEWVMQMSFAQASLDAEILKAYSEEQVERMDPIELKQWFANYVRDNIEIWSNEQRLMLGAGGILLGDHQTDLKFSIPDMPIFPERMKFRMSVCEESHNQTNILRIFQGDDMTKFFLSADNDFSTDLIFQDHEILSMDTLAETSHASLHWGWSALLLLLPAAFYLRRRLA